MNETDWVTRATPDRRAAPIMAFVDYLSVLGPGGAPTVSWQLPLSGAPVSEVRYEPWNSDTGQILSGQSSVYIGPDTETFSLSDLQLGTNYAIRIIPVFRNATGTVSRSSNWIGWRAVNGMGRENILVLTAGSPSGVSQTVDTPGQAFNLEFDYRFTTSTGYLDVVLGGESVGARQEASLTIADRFMHAVFEIEAPFLLDRSGIELIFQLDGPAGSTVRIDNVTFPGIVDGGSDEGLDQWVVQGEGSVSISYAAAGDYHSDNDIDGADLYAFATSYAGSVPDADLNLDRIVNSGDIAEFVQQFGLVYP